MEIFLSELFFSVGLFFSVRIASKPLGFLDIPASKYMNNKSLYSEA